MQAKNGDTVKVHYKGTLEDGSTFDTSAGSEPLSFTIGKGQVIPGFEKAVIGMKVSEKNTVKIPPEDAYGEIRQDFVINAPVSDIPPDLELTVGDELELQQDDGSSVPVRVAEKSKSHVVLDANHPLAGQTLIFEIELVEIS